jgi:hypothetical protein
MGKGGWERALKLSQKSFAAGFLAIELITVSGYGY